MAQQQAEKARRSFARRSPEWAWRFQLLEAEILIRRGLSSDALSLLTPQPPPSLGTGVSILQHVLLGLAYTRLDRLDEARRNLDEAERLSDSTHSAMDGEVARAQGVMAVQLGDLENAGIHFRTSLRVARSQRDTFLEASALLNLGVVAARKEHYDEAIDWTTAAQRLSRAIDAGLDEEKALGNLGWAYYKIGDFEKSQALYLEAEKLATGLGVVGDQVRWQTTIADVLADTGRPAEAERNYQAALQMARQTHNDKQTTDIASTLAFVCLQNGQIDQARNYSDEALALGRAGGDRLDELYPLLAEGEIAALAQDSAGAERLFLEVSRDPKSDVLLRWAAQDDLAQLYEGRHRFEEADQHYRTALRIFEAARSTLHHGEYRLPFLANATRLYDHYLNFLIQNGKIENALLLADYGRAQTLGEGLGLPPKVWRGLSAIPSPRQIARQMRGTLLFYRLGENQSYLWVITPRQVAFYQLPAAPEIDACVQRYRKALQGLRDILETDDPDGGELYKMLLAPARHLIPSNTRVFILPDGTLNDLNFETLVVPEPKPHFWIDDVSVVNAYSLRLLAASRPSPQTGTSKLLLLGDAIAANPEYAELPNASVEMQNIAKHFAPEERRIFARAQATPSAYLGSQPEQFRYIHFAAHGVASRLDPLDSAVVLSGDAGQDDSFKLYARDVIRRPVQASLVTISTCYGAGARAYTGEGLVGLSWAFLRAGAHNVIAALWQVSDDSAPSIMDQLYTELQEGRSPETALRAAKLSLLHSHGVFRKPFYWGPFQLYVGL